MDFRPDARRMMPDAVMAEPAPQKPRAATGHTGSLAGEGQAGKGRRRVAAAGWTALVCAVFAAGCASGPPQDAEPRAPIVFPPAPEEPRYVFEMSLLDSTQVTVDPKKTRMRAWLTGESERGEGMAKPFDVTACKGIVYVSDTVKRRVLAFDFPRRRFFRIGEEEAGALLKPLGLASDASCNLYVADATQRKILVYDAEGRFRAAIGGPDAFRHLSHVAVDPGGARLYAVDTGGVDSRDHRIRVYDVASGAHLFDIGTRGTGDGEFNLPRDIAMGPGGDLYVVDGGNFRIQVFSADGQFRRTFGSMGAQFGQFSRPKGIATDGAGNVYVSDAAFGNFQIFDPEGRLLLFIGNRSAKPGPANYMLPSGIHVDEDGRIYFVDQFFRKVDIYRPVDLPAGEGNLARVTAPDGKK